MTRVASSTRCWRPGRPCPLARPDRQRPDRRRGRPMGGAGPRSAGAAPDRHPARRRRDHRARRDHGRRRDRPAARAAVHGTGRRRDRRRRDRRHPASRSPTCPGRDRPRDRARARALEWFGTGPHETYPDRKRGGLVGRWRPTVTDQYVPYVRPQENGGHADVRWLSLADGDGTWPADRRSTSRARCRRPHIRATDLATATHDVELVAAARDDRPPRRRPSGPRDGELRPGHAAGLPRRARARTAGPGRSSPSSPTDA